jgi:hypothetical protein
VEAPQSGDTPLPLRSLHAEPQEELIDALFRELVLGQPAQLAEPGELRVLGRYSHWVFSEIA